MTIMRNRSQDTRPVPGEELRKTAFSRARSGRDDVLSAFTHASVVYVERDDDPDSGYHGMRLVVRADGTRWIYAYSSLSEVPVDYDAAEPDVIWPTGKRVRELAGEEIGIRLDHGTDHAVDVLIPRAKPVAPPEALQRRPAP